MIRKTTSMTLFLSGLFLLLTSIVLYIEPHGRVAYWADWHFLGLSKGQWDAMHLTVGTLFILAGIFHAFYNWKAIIAYMKNKTRQLVLFTAPASAALILTAFFVIGTLLGWPPMRQILDFGEHIKEGHIATYGNPPYGHAELSKLKRFAGYLGVDLDRALVSLDKAGVAVESPEQALKDIAEKNGISAQRIFEILKADSGVSIPATPPEGTGRMVLADFCVQYGVDTGRAVAVLAAAGMQAAPDMTFKQIAGKAGVTPMDVYGALRDGVAE